MTTAAGRARIAIIGNPNTGKTTVFNALTGHRARVGNYAGVTVERRIGALARPGAEVDIIDLPGTYSLAARSADEMVAVDVLLGHQKGDERPELVLVVLDASNLERNLFLATQVAEVGIPVVGILNMLDAAEAAGIEIDAAMLAGRLGFPVLPAIASKRIGIEEISKTLAKHGDVAPPVRHELLPENVRAEAEGLAARLREAGVAAELADAFLVRRVLLEVGGMAEERIAAAGAASRRLIDESRARLEEQGARLKTLEARLRYGWIRTALEGVVRRPETPRPRRSDAIDAIVTHRVWGTAIFALAMAIVFQAIYSWSAPLMDAISGTFDSLGAWVGGSMADGPLRSFLVKGVIGGVGGVLVFLPQIAILFGFIAVLEDCGYMARAAFLMDRLLSRCGLSGRSFIPMLSGFACAVPGIMAARVIEDRRDRLVTILVTPLMSCSARLPVYTLLIGAFVPDRRMLGGLFGLQGAVLFAMYVVGIAVAVPMALLLKRTLLRGRTPVFLMELPGYKVPHAATVLHRMWERSMAFLVRAGTMIFAVSVLVWAATYYPHPGSIAEGQERKYAAEVAGAGDADAIRVRIDAETEGLYLRNSILGRMGRWMEPAVEPLGWDWRIGMAVLASFPAREVVIATLGVIYDVGEGADEESEGLRDRLHAAKWPDGRAVFTLPVAISIMVFFALCMQCSSTLAVMKRETNSWRWPAFAFFSMTGLAYLFAWIAYRAALALGGGG